MMFRSDKKSLFGESIIWRKVLVCQDDFSTKFQYKIEWVSLFDFGWKGVSSFHNIGMSAFILLGKLSKIWYE